MPFAPNKLKSLTAAALLSLLTLSTAQAAELVVSAAASLTNAFKELSQSSNSNILAPRWSPISALPTS